MSSEQKGFILSVAGYLHLYDKRGGRSNKKRWCWFDERTCSLKYYKDQTSYRNRIDGPLGEIKLASATIIPPMIEGAKGSSHQFIITNDEGTYQFQAKDNKEALDWIRKLQEKRSEYHKTTSARESHREATKLQTALRTSSGSRGLLEGSPEVSPVGVRKIMQQILSTPVPPGTASATVDEDSPRKSLVEDTDEISMLSEDGAVSRLSLVSNNDDATDGSLACIGATEEQLQLEYYKSHETSTMYYKEMQKMKKKLELKDIKINALNVEIDELKEKLAAVNVPQQVIQLQEEKANLEKTLKQLLESIKVFVNEVDQHKEQALLNEKKIIKEKKKNVELEKSMNQVKKRYIQVLNDSLTRSTISSSSSRDNFEITSNPRLLELLEEEGWETGGVFEDEYGDVHDWNSGLNVQHFLCRCLYVHYSQFENEALCAEWESFLQRVSTTVSSDKSKKEFRDLLRKGLPLTHRKGVWTILVNRHIAKTKEVKDHSSGGVSYYQTLLNSAQQSMCRKQIDLDLHRTMPSNTYFKRGGSGIPQLENVLIAYSVHNKNVGYCQGMNMIAALGLLFLDEETTFWYMVAIIEKILPPGYYECGLLGAQADQAVLKEILATEIADLSTHMATHYIDITFVTLNWFLTLFIDAVPTECALRIMDVFLNEGHKVMHRMAIGILKLYKDNFLSMTDPVTLLQILKDISRRTYTIEDIFSAGYSNKDFPRRSFIASRLSYHMNLFSQDWQKRQKETQVHKEVTAVSVVRPPPQPATSKRVLQWECGSSIRIDKLGEALCLCSGEKDQGIIAVITVQEKARMEIVPDIVIKGRAVCMKYIPSCDMVLIGTLDFYVYAVDCLQWKKLWFLRLIDSVLNMEVIENTVFFALAEGSLAIIKNIGQTCPLSEPLLLHIGSSSVPCLALAPNQMLWCGSEKSITILSTATCELEKSIVLDDDDLGKIYKMKCGQHGVWVSFRSSTIICLFDVNNYRKLLQVDYVTLPTSETHDRITAILPVQGYLWVGTGDGTIHILSVKASGLPAGEVDSMDLTASVKSHGSSVACGLVTVEEEEEGVEDKGEEAEDNKEVEAKKNVTENEVKHTSQDSPPFTTSNRLYRKSRFGTTLRRRKKLQQKEEKLGPYLLTIEASRHVIESRKEPVRTLQAWGGPDNSTVVVSTVHTDSDKAVQMWRCSDQHASNWGILYLQCSDK